MIRLLFSGKERIDMLSKSTRFDFLVFIGRFQPFHLGHDAVIRKGLDMAHHVIVLAGSAHQPRSSRNPWLVKEREAMVSGAFSEEERQRIHVAPLMDMLYNDERWVRNVQATVNGLVTAHHATFHMPPKIGLIGHMKDKTSFYLNLFPQWGSVSVPNCGNIHATAIREAYFKEGISSEKTASQLPESVRHYLMEFQKTTLYQEIKDEHDFIMTYRRSWESAPYPPIFTTVDAVVVQSGHILLVERKARPGKGLMALPGGFVDADEKLLDACLRELREETRLKVPAPVLKGSIRRREVFDAPFRSMRGRTITYAFYMELSPNAILPKVKGGDDARHAFWIPLADLNPSKLFEDHYFIIQEMTGM